MGLENSKGRSAGVGGLAAGLSTARGTTSATCREKEGTAFRRRLVPSSRREGYTALLRVTDSGPSLSRRTRAF